jgi:signal transduction histidine kinase
MRAFALVFLLLVRLLSAAAAPAGPAEAGQAAASSDTALVRRYLARSKVLRNTNLDSSRFLAAQALRLARRSRFAAGQARAQLAVANGHYYAGDFPAAEHAYEAAQKLAQRTQLCSVEGGAYLGLGLVGQALGNVPGAIRYLEKARVLYAGCQPYNPRNELAVLTNLGTTYLFAGQTTQAERPLRQALALTTPATDAPALLVLLDLVGILQSRQQHLDSAVVTWQQELRLARAVDNRRGQCYAAGNLASACLQRRQPAAALAYAEQAVRLARQLGNQAQLTDNLLVLAQALHAAGRPGAFDTLSCYLVLHDTITGRARSEAVAQAQARFDVAGERTRVRELEQQRRIARLEAEQRATRSRLQLGALAALCLLLVLGLTAAYRRRQRRRDAALRSQLAADLHDDVGTLLSQIALKTDLLQEGLGEPGQQQQHWAEVADSSRMAVRHLNDVVWNLSAHNDSVPDLLNRLRDYAHEVLVPSGRDVRFLAEARWAEPHLAAPVRRNLYLIYKEALHNILKYAPLDATVTVSLRREQGWLTLDVVNSGPLVSAGRQSGHGLRNVRERARVLGGMASAGPRADGGFAVVVRVPV